MKNIYFWPCTKIQVLLKRVQEKMYKNTVDKITRSPYRVIEKNSGTDSVRSVRNNFHRSEKKSWQNEVGHN